MERKEFYRELMGLEWAVVLRFLLLLVPISLSSGAAWWAFSVEDSPSFVRVSCGMACGFCWYLLVRHLFVSAAAWDVLMLKVSHWSSDQDVARVLRLGVSNQRDDRVQVLQPERIVPVRTGGGAVLRTMAGFAVDDLAHFVDRSFELGRFGTSERNWLGYKMPSGRVIETIDEWRELQEVFSDVGLLVDVGIERKCSKWIVHGPDVVKDTMRLPVAPPALPESALQPALM